MLTPKEILGQFPGGRVLDVATGGGNFIHFLLDGLKDYAEIIGIDSNNRSAAAFDEAFKDKKKIRFRVMDATHLEFDTASFDLVCLSNSLHHFNDPQLVLREMERVLRPGGGFLVAEMYSDGQTEAQMTHVHLHHWWAAVDRMTGVVHNQTYRREELLEMVNGLGLRELVLFDLSETDEDPKSPETLAELEPVIERYLQRAEGHPELQERGRELRQRVQEIGFHGATSLLALGTKPIRD
jgi:ubiquinone/menaquinone biosynthesis C-methylase UbiE